MIREYCCEEGRLTPCPEAQGAKGHEVVGQAGAARKQGFVPSAAVWIDLQAPDAAEEAAMEKALGMDIPTLEEMREIEISSRLFQRGNTLFMTANIPAANGDWLENGPVTFILQPEGGGGRPSGRLVTIRYHAPRPFDTLPTRMVRLDLGCGTSVEVLIALFETIVDDVADMTEDVGRRIDTLSREVFSANDGQHPQQAIGEERALDEVLGEIGRLDDALSKLRESLATFGRIAGFLARRSGEIELGAANEERLQTVNEDVRSLVDHTAFLAGKITFLLDATMGLINIEQNAIIKIFSVVAVVFLPPTLIASIYGMNFHYMPELSWPWGYPLALGVMVISAVLPWLYFKWRGWM